MAGDRTGLMIPTLIGYFPKKRTPVPDWLSGTNAKEICSVSECLAAGPEGWIDRWLHNDWGYYNSPAEALSLIPAGAADFQLLAFSLFPLRFAAGAQYPMRISVPEIQAVPSSFEQLGYDVPSQSESHFFECSPLSCNAMGREIPVNSYCLLDDLETAFQAAARFSVEQPEPGAYFIVLVHRFGCQPA